MDDDDVITAVLGQLQQQHGVEPFTAAASVNRQFGRLAALDLFWRELCARRWELFPDAPLYRAAAEADIAAAQAAVTEGDSAPQGGAPAAAAALWRGAYVKREAELERDYPCFCMPGNLRLTEPIGLHFFEPRYRKLIAVAMQTDRRFVWASGGLRPYLNPTLTPTPTPTLTRFVWASGRLSAGQRVYLCEAHNVRTYPDGRADLHVLPVHECIV